MPATHCHRTAVEGTAAARGEETVAVAREVVAMAAAKAAVTEQTWIGRRLLRRMREQEQGGQIGDTPMYSRMKTLTSAGILRFAAGCSFCNEGAT
jgi:hypothetical protein